MTSLDATLIMPKATQQLQSHHYIKERWYFPLPSLHVSGNLKLLRRLKTDRSLGAVCRHDYSTPNDSDTRLGCCDGTCPPTSGPQ